MVVVPDNRPVWKCQKCGQLIGRVEYRNRNQVLNMVKERGILLIGDADVHCLKCGEIREWHMGTVGIDHLVNRVIEGRRKAANNG